MGLPVPVRVRLGNFYECPSEPETISPPSPHNMEQLHAEFTQHVFAEKDVDCERTACDSNGGIILAGQRRYYVFPKLDKNGIAHGPGKWCCKKCYIYYRSQKDTVIRNVPATTIASHSESASTALSPLASAMVPDINSIRQSVNESQRQGK
jgi:hypothetical protein